MVLLTRDEIALFFTEPHLPADAHERYACTTSVTKGHGRLETRTLECVTGWCVDWHWPDVAHVVRRTCERVVCKTGKRSVEVSYGITSLTVDEAGAVDLERLWQAHWTIEIASITCAMSHLAKIGPRCTPDTRPRCSQHCATR